MIKKMLTASVCIVILLSIFSGCSVRRTAIENVQIVSNAVKYRRDEEVPDTNKNVLTAKLARNEAEGMQFILNFDKDVKNVKVSVSDLTDGTGHSFTPEQVEIFRQHYIYTESNSSQYKEKSGWYPDALIPLCYDDLNISDIHAGENQGYWVTVTSSIDQPAGIYTGEITITYDGGSRTIPMEVEVWDFTLPEESSFYSAYLMWYGSAWDYMDKNNATANASYYDVMEDYYDFFLNYRITSTTPPTQKSNWQDPVGYANELVDFFKTHPRATCFQIYLNVDDLIESGRAPSWFVTVADILRENGMLDKMFTYMFDEPGDDPALNQKITKAINAVKSSVPDVKNLITTAPRESLYGVVDPWCGIWSSKTLMENYVRDRQALGEEVWWYGCVAPRTPYPTYHIQDALMSSRLVHWMQKDWNIQGNLYWATMLCDKLDPSKGTFTAPRDIWTDPNVIDEAPGDGYLVYVGTENDGVINRNIPVPTLRLESIRDGAEDYEYLTLLQEKIEQKLEEWEITDVTADSIMDTYYTPLYNTMGDFDRNPDMMIQMRERIAHDIMNIEAVVAVYADMTQENNNMRKVTVYAQDEASVVIDGQRVQGEEKGLYREYSLDFDMRQTDKKEIKIVVDGEIYNRTLKSIEDYEYIELGEERVMANADALGLSKERVALREIYDKNMFKPLKTNNLGTLEGQLGDTGTGERLPIVINDDEKLTEKIKSCIVSDMHNTIPLVIQNASNSSLAGVEDLTLYVPAGATVKVNGEDAALQSTSEYYALYSYSLNCNGDVNCFYEVTVTYNGITEIFYKQVINKITKTYKLLDFTDSGIEEILSAFNEGPEMADFELKDDSLYLTFNPYQGNQSSFILDRESFIDGMRDFTPYNCISIEVTNTGTEKAKGFSISFENSRELVYSDPTGDIDAGQTKVLYIKIPPMSDTQKEKMSSIGFISSISSGSESYKITNISLMYNTDFE